MLRIIDDLFVVFNKKIKILLAVYVKVCYNNRAVVSSVRLIILFEIERKGYYVLG